MGQIKNIKLHIVTDIKREDQYRYLTSGTIVIERRRLVAMTHAPLFSLPRDDCFKSSMPWKLSATLVLVSASSQRTVSCLLQSAAIPTDLPRSYACGTACVQSVRFEAALHSSWWLSPLWCLPTVHGMGPPTGIPVVSE